MSNGELSPKEARFVAEYLKDQNGTQAAARAGYSKKTANEQAARLLARVNVRGAVDRALGDAAKRAGIDAEYVLSSLKEVVERCMQRKRVMIFDKVEKEMVQATDETGEGVWEFDANGANKALELLGKNLKLFTEKLEHSGKDGQPLTIEIVNYGKAKNPA